MCHPTRLGWDKAAKYVRSGTKIECRSLPYLTHRDVHHPVHRRDRRQVLGLEHGGRAGGWVGGGEIGPHRDTNVVRKGKGKGLSFLKFFFLRKKVKLLL